MGNNIWATIYGKQNKNHIWKTTNKIKKMERIMALLEGIEIKI